MYASVGLAAINTIPIATSQAMFAMQLKDIKDIDFLYYYLNYFRYRHIHKYLETGTQSNINADIVRGIMIPDYGTDRNIEISNALLVIDQKIDNESIVLNNYNSTKQYLLSQMFIWTSGQEGSAFEIDTYRAFSLRYQFYLLLH